MGDAGPRADAVPGAGRASARVAAAVLGAVLVGGASRRMGTDKALIEIDGVPMVDRTAAVLRDAGCRPVVAVGPLRLSGRLPHLDDRHPGEGPLGAILTVLEVAAPAVVLACDLPWLDAWVIRQLIEAERNAPAATDAIAARSDRIEPLCALWRASALAPLQRAFDAGERAVHRAMGALTLVEVPVPASNLRNANRPSDLEPE